MPGPEILEVLRIAKIGVTTIKPWSTAWVSGLGRTRRIIQRQGSARPAAKKVIKYSGIPSLPFNSCAQGVHQGWMAWCASLRGLKGNWLHGNDKVSHVHREWDVTTSPFQIFCTICGHGRVEGYSILLFAPKTLCENTFWLFCLTTDTN